MAFLSKVGSFVKTTSAATASQAVTGVGFQPKALILYTGKMTAVGLNSSNSNFAIGITDGSTSKCWGFAGGVNGLSQDSEQFRRSKCIAMMDNLGANISEADLTSFDSDGFTLSWTSNEATAYIVYYIALGGSDLSAKVVEWQIPASTGSFSVTGVGFQPTGMLTIGGGGTTAPSTTGAHAEMCLSAMGTSGQTPWASSSISVDNFGLTVCGQAHDTGIIDTNNAGTGSLSATFTSYDSDGFTFNYSVIDSRRYRASLCLAGTGIDFKSGTFNKTSGAAPANQTVSFTGGGQMDVTWNPNNTGASGPIMYFAVPGMFSILSGKKEVAADGAQHTDAWEEWGATDGTTHHYVIAGQNSGLSSSAAPLTYTGNNTYGDILSGGTPSPSSIISAVTLGASDQEVDPNTVVHSRTIDGGGVQPEVLPDTVVHARSVGNPAIGGALGNARFCESFDYNGGVGFTTGIGFDTRWLIERGYWSMNDGELTPYVCNWPNIATWHYDTESDDQVQSFDITALDSAVGTFVAAINRVVSTLPPTREFYQFTVTTGSLEIGKWVADVYTTLDTDAGYTYTPGDRLKARSIGATHQLLINDTVMLEVTDSDVPSSKRLGIYIEHPCTISFGLVRVDNYLGGDASVEDADCDPPPEPLELLPTGAALDCDSALHADPCPQGCPDDPASTADEQPVVITSFGLRSPLFILGLSAMLPQTPVVMGLPSECGRSFSPTLPDPEECN